MLPREPPPRTGEVPRIIHGSSLTAATIAWQLRPPVDSMTIVVKGTFDLVPDGPARLREESELPTGDLHLDDDPQKSVAYASDFAILKPKADVTVVGHAHAPGGSSPAAQVVFRFGAGKGRLERTLTVFGDRRWQKSIVSLAPTDPQPFERIPLVYERAFGGPSYDRNPVGVGHKAAAGADGVARLPNVELPGHLVTSPGDSPPPASFAPIPATWKERWSKLGTYDRSWFKARWPYFPEDFDWTHFQAAPAAQQVEHLTGDEPYEIAGMHRDHPLLRGRLPGLRARAFVQKTREHGGAFAEVRLVLDTAAFDMDGLKLNLVWRGFVEVSDEDAPEIQHIFVTAEALADPPMSLEEARGIYVARATPKEPVAAPPEVPAPANDDRPPREDPELAKIDRLVAEATRAREAALEAAGLTAGVVPPAPPAPEPAAIAASLRASGASEEDVAAVLAALAPPKEAPRAAPPARERVVAMLEAGKSFDGLNLEGADLSELDFSGRSLVGASLRGADLRWARFEGAKLMGALLADANLADAVLEKADLSASDLKRARIDRARFLKATLDRADFSNASGEGAGFAGAHGTRARFVEASLRESTFDGAALVNADFTSADLLGASFTGADLPNVRLYDATGEGVVFDEAKMKDARAEGASFPRGSFRNIEAEGAVLERAKLGEATFQGANLKGASLLRASCVKAVLSQVDLSDARLRRADLRSAVLLKANLKGANLERADLTGADLRGANLHAAGLWKAKIQDAKLDAAIVTKSTLVMRRPP